ncbi:hypothetical protein QPK32_14055 [Massilia sp. YIM B02763]|uniref:hypothetical protein n=1 Tax=Massilia sp. YIM B02763 TaxID=3050130 RepID=UPI0025B6FBCF|nr:hypothetical protein [Massilia sp. YIM B02763]MDN4054205.1 hypothetical protein [Massilia sp. YIM B02763]
MPSQDINTQLFESKGAEDRFRKAFERLKINEPKMLRLGTPVTQNNVAREAGCDPSALKKARFPALVREIQAYIELHPEAENAKNQKIKKKRAANRTLKERLDDTVNQRDQAQSIIASAGMRILELLEKINLLEKELNELRPTAKISHPF